MKRAIIVLMVCFIALGGCTQRMICPAYQSAFIYDKETLRKKFSYFKEDSTPKVLMASKTRYLIAEPISYQKKIRTMETVEMKPIFPVVPDSLRDDFVSKAELDSAARSIIDSTYIVDVNQPEDSVTAAEDSIYVITKDKEVRFLKYDPDSMKYAVVEMRLNVDQDNYMWYLRDVLVLPDVRLAKTQAREAAKEKKEKKGFFGFFKNLFKKKKDKPDSTVVPIKSPDEFDYVDTLQTAKPIVTNVQPKKKGFFSFLKRNKKAKTDQEVDKQEAEEPEEKPLKNNKAKKKQEDTDPADANETADPKKEEEKDDGF